MKKYRSNSIPVDQIGYFGKPTFTKEDLIETNIMENRMRALGIRIPDSFSGVNSKDENRCTYTKDEREALKYIYSNKAIPTDLEQRLIDRQIPERKNTTHDITLDDNEI